MHCIDGIESIACEMQNLAVQLYKFLFHIAFGIQSRLKIKKTQKLAAGNASTVRCPACRCVCTERSHA